MKHPYHSGNRNDAAKEAVKVEAFINELDRRVRLLDCDIAREEGLAGVSNPCSGAYPALARTLTAQRDNLKQTIAALEQRLALEPVQVA